MTITLSNTTNPNSVTATSPNMSVTLTRINNTYLQADYSDKLEDKTVCSNSIKQIKSQLQYLVNEPHIQVLLPAYNQFITLNY